MIIYESNENNFNNNGLGFLNDCLSANVVENLNGDMYLEFSYPINGLLSEYLVQDNIIKANTGNNNYQLFRISRVIKSFYTIDVYAPHIFYDLLNNFLLDTSPTNLIAESFGNWILSKTNFETPFVFRSDINFSASARYVRRNPVEAIIGDIDTSMVNLFRGELERDNFTIKLLQNRGHDNGEKLIFGKNIKEIKITTDTSSILTRILPLGFDGLMIPEIYIDSPIINNYISPRVAKIEFSNIKFNDTLNQDGTWSEPDSYHTLEEAYNALRLATNELYNAGIDKPTINIKIDWLELSKTEEYKNYRLLESVSIGDTIKSNVLGIDYTTKIIKTTYNVLTDTIEKFEIGSSSATIGKTINSNAKKIENISITSILQSAKDNATTKLQNALGGYVYKTQNELFIMDTNDPATAIKVWRWNLNGLGYSSTGINGEYQTAMTQDGQIVADFITTGTMSAERIVGLKDVILDEYGAYIHIGDNGEIEVGRQDYEYKIVIENDGIKAKRGDETISSWKQNIFTAQQLNLGNYSFIPRHNGSLSFRKTGGD